MAQSASSKRSLGQRLTAKAGPLPVWAWAAVILGAYLLYSHFHTAASSSSTTASTDGTSTDTTDQTPVTSDTSGNPPASGQGGPADNMTGDPLSTSIDALTAAIQSSQAFSGSDPGNSGSQPWINLPDIPAVTPPKSTAAAIPKPAAKPAPSRYYTYAPGKAPKGQAANQAPAKGPAGTTLHFTKGKGYFYE